MLRSQKAPHAPLSWNRTSVEALRRNSRLCSPHSECQERSGQSASHLPKMSSVGGVLVNGRGRGVTTRSALVYRGGSHFSLFNAITGAAVRQTEALSLAASKGLAASHRQNKSPEEEKKTFLWQRYGCLQRTGWHCNTVNVFFIDVQIHVSTQS